MKLIGIEALSKFQQKHNQSRKPLNAWKTIIESGSFRNLVELQKALKSAEAVHTFTIFNIGGNKYRVATEIDYGSQIVVVTHVLTHAEYDKVDWAKE